MRGTERRPPVRMVHYKPALSAKLVPDCKCRTNCAARIAGRRLHVNASKGRHPPHLSIGNGVHRAAARQREVGESRSLLQTTEQVKERFLVHGLRGTSNVSMAVLERLVRQTPRPEEILERGGKQVAEFRRPVRPFISYVLTMVAEEFQIEFEATSGEQAHNLAHGVDQPEMAIRREAHHLIFVAIMRKAEILRERLIENTERMRKIHAAIS